MKSIVIGQGQVGQAVTEVISEEDEEVITYDSKSNNEPPIVKGVDIIHVCFPYTEEEKFLKAVEYYKEKYQTRHVVIWSTVAIGVTKKIRGAIHSPIEGRHPRLASSIRSMTRWIGFNHGEDCLFFQNYFMRLRLPVRAISNSDFTEFLKLRSTSKYGINLVWADYEAHVAAELGMDFQLLKEFDRDYNKLYHNLGIDWAQRYILDAPGGKIGGHCVRENSFLLDADFPSDMLKMIQGMDGSK